MNQILEKKRNEILQIAEQHGAHNLRIFGSVARGEDNQDSDIDILIELENGRTLLDHVALMQDLEDLLGRKVDVVEAQALHWYIRDKILEESIAL